MGVLFVTSFSQGGSNIFLMFFTSILLGSSLDPTAIMEPSDVDSDGGGDADTATFPMHKERMGDFVKLVLKQTDSARSSDTLNLDNLIHLRFDREKSKFRENGETMLDKSTNTTPVNDATTRIEDQNGVQTPEIAVENDDLEKSEILKLLDYLLEELAGPPETTPTLEPDSFQETDTELTPPRNTPRLRKGRMPWTYSNRSRNRQTTENREAPVVLTSEDDEAVNTSDENSDETTIAESAPTSPYFSLPPVPDVVVFVIMVLLVMGSIALVFFQLVYQFGLKDTMDISSLPEIFFPTLDNWPVNLLRCSMLNIKHYFAISSEVNQK